MAVDTPAMPAYAAGARERPGDKESGMNYTISAVDRALALLEVLAENADIGVAELAERTGNTKSLVFRLLFTLEQRGYVQKDPVTRTYALGYRPLYLADHVRQQSRLIVAAQPYLDALVEQTHENVILVVREELHSVCIAMRESPQPLRLSAQRGQRSPLHVGGGPKVLLAFAPEEVQQRVLNSKLRGFTETSITDPKALARTLAEIRATEFTRSYGEMDPDAFSLAAPVRDHGGAVVAALSVAGPVRRITDEVANHHASCVRDAAAGLSRDLGYPPRSAVAQ